MLRVRTLYAVAAAAILSAVASPAVAQVCLGHPIGIGSTAAVATFGFPDHANSYGIGALHRVNDAILVSGGYTMTSYDADVSAAHTIRGGVAYEIPLVAVEGTGISVCPNVGLGYTSWDELNGLTVPVGVGIGAGFPIMDNTAVVVPYINPQFVWNRMSYDGDSISDTDFGFTAGANLQVANLLFGVLFDKVGEGDGVFGIRFGYTF